MYLLKDTIVKVRDMDGRIVGQARVGNYYPAKRLYHIEFFYNTGECEEIDVPGWCLVLENKHELPDQHRVIW